jgi:hypothetical protein
MMNRIRIGSFLLLAIASAAGAQMEQQVVAVGAQTIVRVDFPIGRSALANDNVCDFRILESRQEVLLIGRKAGETTLSLWDQQGTLQREILVRVRPSSGGARQITEELKELLGGIEGVEYRGRGHWLAEGEVLTQRLDRISKVRELPRSGACGASR